MGEKEITEIASNKAIMLQESRVRCIVDNAKCITKASFKPFSKFPKQPYNLLYIVPYTFIFNYL